jgi:hypothetical protein
MSKFTLLNDAAARVTAAGIPITKRGVRGWTERYRDLSARVGGRRAIRSEALDLILTGKSLRDVAAMMRARSTNGGATERE